MSSEPLMVSFTGSAFSMNCVLDSGQGDLAMARESSTPDASSPFEVRAERAIDARQQVIDEREVRRGRAGAELELRLHLAQRLEGRARLQRLEEVDGLAPGGEGPDPV